MDKVSGLDNPPFEPRPDESHLIVVYNLAHEVALRTRKGLRKWNALINALVGHNTYLGSQIKMA